MRFHLSSLLLFFVLLSFITAAQKDSLIIIPGTHCSMVPPEGFVIADRFTGFQNNSTGSSIMVNEIPESYEKIIPGLTPEAFLKQRMVITGSEKISFNGSEATIFKATQTQSGMEYNKLLLVFGSGTKTILVNGIYPVSASHLDTTIWESLLTTKYGNDEFESSPAIFTISTDGTGFKEVSSMGMNTVYSPDSAPATNPDAPLFILGNSVDKISKENRKAYAESRIMSLPRGDQNKITSINPISIDSLDGYEIFADGKSRTGAAQKIYQVIVYNSQGDYYIMVGTATKDLESTLKIFKQLAMSFTLRKS